MFQKKLNLKAYTLSEIVIVMLIISVVVAVTIGITKRKLESSISYSYYAAYASLKDVSRALITDFNPKNVNYQALNSFEYLVKTSGYNKYTELLKSLWEQPAYGACTYDSRSGCYNCGSPIGPLQECSSGRLCNGQCWDCPNAGCPQELTCPEGYQEVQEGCGKICADGSVANTPRGEKCPEESCDPNAKNDCDYSGGYFNYSTCTCTPNNSNQDGASSCNIGDTPPECGKICTDGQWQDIVGFSKECDPDIEEWIDLPDCKCVPVARTLPRNGKKFCEQFEQRINTNMGECDGSNISPSVTDFNDKTPDIVLRNGIKLYNLHMDPQRLNELQGNKSGFTVQYKVTSSGTDPVQPVVTTMNIDTGEYGYIVYLDIDGEKGSSTLWEDVYPFYITLSGQVVPAYNTYDGENLGGNSDEYLQTSIQYEKISPQGRRSISWLAKSVSYKEGACGSGYINSSTPYCSGVAQKSECSSGTLGSKCSLKTVKPVKFL